MSGIQQCSVVNIDSWARLCEMSWQCRPITHLILLTMVVSKFACHICLRFAVFYPCNPLVKSFQLIPFNHSWMTHISSTASQLPIKLLTPPSCPVQTKNAWSTHLCGLEWMWITIQQSSIMWVRQSGLADYMPLDREDWECQEINVNDKHCALGQGRRIQLKFHESQSLNFWLWADVVCTLCDIQSVSVRCQLCLKFMLTYHGIFILWYSKGNYCMMKKCSD